MGSILFLAVLSALFILAHANKKPSFVEDLKNRLQIEGISENAPKNQSLGFIKCTDPDGDPITYSITSKYLAVNASTGEVTVKGNLDREESSNSQQSGGNQPYTVRFICSDSESNIYSDLIISVKDENDQKPLFLTDSPTGYTFSVSESEEIGYKLNGTLTVTDKDKEDPNANIQRVELVCQPPARPADCDHFNLTFEQVKLGLYTVNLYVKELLDYEDEAVYVLGIIAVDGDSDLARVNTGSVGILINVLDSQDTPPRFQNPVLNFNVKEGLSVGTELNFRLSAMDMDTTHPRDIAFEILRQNDTKPVDFFRAGQATNQGPFGIFSAPVIVNVPIDREQASDVYTFVAKATELDSAGQFTSATATALFTVYIKDVNDNAPKFSKNVYNVTIPEADKAVANQTITVEGLQVNDLDRLNNAKYRLEVFDQSFSGAFGVVPNTEVEGAQGFNLIVNNYQLVDYDVEAYRTQNVVLLARETVTDERLSSTATVIITITDVNDHNPEFYRERYEGSISENDPIDTSILTLSATDDDSGTNGQIYYRLSEQTTKFKVDNLTGLITLNSSQINYEEKRSYVFLAYAVDHGNPARSSQVSVVVQVVDYNEDGPQFTSQQYRAEVNDGNRVFNERVQVEAIDPTDTNANITYRLVEGNTANNAFYLDPFTGVLTLQQNITYGMTPDQSGSFRLKVEATDNGVPPLSQEAYIIVDVLAQNRNSPIFNPTTYTKTISETSPPGEYLLTVSATDADHGTNGKITFRIGTGGRDSFIVRENGSVYISPSPTFDYDAFKSLVVQVVATDGGSPQHSATALLYVTVTDSNNKNPVLSQRLYNKVIDEGTARGTIILQVSADDPDTTRNLLYSIDTNSIEAYSKAGVLVNDVAYNMRSVFEINPTTGEISVSTSGPGLNRNYVAEMSFNVKVIDTNGVDQSDTSMVTVIITGQPNTQLFFNRPWTESSPYYVVLVSEATEVGMEIKTLQARDPVDGTVLTDYREISGDPNNYFTLSTVTPGKVLLSKALDYEKVTERRHSVVIVAVKGRTGSLPDRTATVTVIMEVQDANDNPPMFTRPDYSFIIPEDSPLDYEVTRITAFDQDSPSFGPVEFIMGIGQDRNDFRLERTASAGTVRLLVNRKLDYEKRDSYQLEIICKDNSREGTSSSLRLESRTQVKISLTDVNDNQPTFTDRKRAFSVPETAEIDTRLGQVLAQDDDTGLFGDLDYSLHLDGSSPQGVNPLMLFGITQLSGVLVTRQSLRGLSGLYKLRVVATDRGSPPKSDSIPVEIKVQGVEDDDGTPRWVSPIQFVTYVTEHNQTKLDITLHAEPRTINASIVYSLGSFAGDAVGFSINRVTGDIQVIADLDYEEKPVYTLVVEATDTLNPDKMSRRELTVYLIDIDDNSPSFEKSNYSACPNDFEVPTEYSVMDDTLEDTIVGYAVACDPDGPDNNHMFYYRYNGNKICQENYNDAFQVNMNGSIQSNKVLDYEEKTDYLVCVEVRSSQSTAGRRRKRYEVGEMTNTTMIAYVIVRIVDVNDNGPEFPDTEVVGVLETLPTEDTVTRVTANDRDGPLNNRVLYTIKSIQYYPASGTRPFSMRGAFAINQDNGVISTTLPSYKDFAYGHFQLLVEAFDAKNRQFNDTVVVTMVVYQKSQILKVVLNQSPDQGQLVAVHMIQDLNAEGKDDGKQFFLIKASEHRQGSNIVPTQTDVCLVIVENKLAFHAGQGMEVLDTARYSNIMNNYKMVNRGACYQLLSSEDSVKWRDLWWVLVVVAIFIFFCCLILIITVCILYDKYKNYMTTERTYLVPH